MRFYKRLATPEYNGASCLLKAIQIDDIESIRLWRNQQIPFLRQNHQISELEQRQYFEEIIWPQLNLDEPECMIFSVFRAGELVAYGGLVHISWTDRRAELSFLMNPKFTETSDYRKTFVDFLEVMKKLAFDELKLHRLYTETFSINQRNFEILESSGFTLEGTLTDHVYKAGYWYSSTIHGLISPITK